MDLGNEVVDLKKLKDPNVLETFQAMIGREFAPLSLTIMNSEDTVIETMIATFNTAVVETTSVILGSYRQKKHSGSLQKFLICATTGVK